GTPALPGNEVHGGPETGWIFGRCERWFANAAGSVGRPVPGRSIEIIDHNGNVVPPGPAGYIAVHISDPGLMTEYCGSTARTAASFIGDWFLTGDVGYKSGDGDLYIQPSPSVVGTH
ncbi:MAG TPA: hypothetical protein VI837_04100, partial [Blastocatellia bacterium]|nr:hypothetical protein [Blastocatellia bacterium]